MRSRFEMLHLFICAIAAFAVTACCAYMRVGLYRMAMWVSITLAAFYVLGQVVRLFLKRAVFPAPTHELDGEEDMSEEDGLMDSEMEIGADDGVESTYAYAEDDNIS